MKRAALAYDDYVSRRICFADVGERLYTGLYRSAKDWYADISLVYDNCRTYWGSTADGKESVEVEVLLHLTCLVVWNGFRGCLFRSVVVVECLGTLLGCVGLVVPVGCLESFC